MERGLRAGSLFYFRSCGLIDAVVPTLFQVSRCRICLRLSPLFQNAAGLESVGKGYFTASSNSGDPVALTSGSGSAGRIEGQRLEKSNVQVAEEFVTMIQAQNGFQANARTIRVANEVLRELTNLIR